MYSLVKLGGSVLTRKTSLFSFQTGTAARLAREIRESGQVPVIVYGTGTAGKAYARHYSRIDHSTSDWLIFQLTTRAIRTLGDELSRVLRDEGVPHCLLPVNALFYRRRGQVGWYGPGVLSHLLDCGVAPILCGDVLAEGRACFRILSSDDIVSFLALVMPVKSCVFVTDVDGVLDQRGALVAEIGGSTQLSSQASDREDITGGMAAKLRAARQAAGHGATVTIVNGHIPGRLRDALRGSQVTGTRVLTEESHVARY